MNKNPFLAAFTILVSLSSFCFSQDRFPAVSNGDRGWPTIVAQQLLNERMRTSLTLDGQAGTNTTVAIRNLQRRLGDFPNGMLADEQWEKLLTGAKPKFLIHFIHGSFVKDNSSTPENDSLYDSEVIVYLLEATGPRVLAKFRGSIMPDDLTSRGRLVDGAYPIQIGFHRRQKRPRQDDLTVKTNGLRPCLVVNRDNAVAVASRNPSKKTSTAIHIHNGFKVKRESLGCPTISPKDWPTFLGLFMQRYPKLNSWTGDGQFRGQFVGALIVSSK